MTKILPHLYVGSYENAMNELELKAKKITHILSLIGPSSTIDFVKHEHFPMSDHGKTDVKQVLAWASEFIKEGQEGDNNLLLHCKIGQNRAPTLLIAYLMMNEKKKLYQAHKELKTLRPSVHINVLYAKQLLELEKELFNKNSLPSSWMERGGLDEESGEITFKYEHMDTAEQKAMFKSDEI